ncbi:hypothetical protein ACXU4B_04780 [Dyella soli]|uniref:Uncharacterized protein n=1 Tax=Dyella soli TaxID=522319 RepID=A0A4V6N9Z6_9GAMM|nr:hypothetical protein [Dyella soli]TCI10331.1 hypothetical protein EZM97_15665 [Dyella soli]
MRATMTGLAFLLAGMGMAAMAQVGPTASGSDLHARDTYFRASWKSTCSVPGGPSSIAFTSAGGDATEDDMQVVASWPDGSTTHLGLTPGLFPQSSGFAGGSGGCEGIGVTLPRQDQMLLWIERDERPARSRMALVLLDTSQRRVLDVVNDAGNELWGDEPCLSKAQPGLYEAVLVGAYQDRGPTAEPLPLPRIMRIEVIGNRLRLTWGDWLTRSHRKGKCFDA